VFNGDGSDAFLLNIFAEINAAAKDSQLGVLYCSNTGNVQINIDAIHTVSIYRLSWLLFIKRSLVIKIRINGSIIYSGDVFMFWLEKTTAIKRIAM